MINLLEWLADTYGVHADEWERILTLTWLYLTPPVLTLTMFVLLARLVVTGSWRRRMPRASFALVSSYTFIMWRFIYLRYTGAETLVQPWALFLWTYSFWATAYFGFAVLTEQVIPAMFRLAFWLAARICRYQWGQRFCNSRFCTWVLRFLTRTRAANLAVNKVEHLDAEPI